MTTRALRLVGDPTRARMLALILGSRDQRALVGELAIELGLSQPTVSHHARALLDDGILTRHPEGRRVWYEIAPTHQEYLANLLATEEVQPDEEAFARVVRDLTARYAGVFNAQTVEAYVSESRGLIAARDGVTHQLTSLTARFAAERLDALAASQAAGDRAPEVLFVCVHNSGRSQMASAIMRQLAGDKVVVRTAGSAPQVEVRAAVLSALDEIGVSLAGEYPKPLTDEVVQAADIIITMGCGDVCPIYPSKQYLDWDIEDPAGLPLLGVRAVRDDIDARVRELLGTLQL